MTDNNPRRRIEQAIKSDSVAQSHGGVEPICDGDKFVIRVSQGIVGAPVLNTLEDVGMEIIGVTHQKSHTDLHVTETDQ